MIIPVDKINNVSTLVVVHRCFREVFAHESQNLRLVQSRQRSLRIFAPHSAQKFGRCNVRSGMCEVPARGDTNA